MPFNSLASAAPTHGQRRPARPGPRDGEQLFDISPSGLDVTDTHQYLDMHMHMHMHMAITSAVTMCDNDLVPLLRN